MADFLYDYGFIGCGNMGGAILRALAGAQKENKAFVYDIDKNKADAFAESFENVTCADGVNAVFTSCRYVFLGLKPQVLPAFLEKNADKSVKYEATFVSMAAGTAVEKIAGFFGEGTKIIRIMPNIPVSVGQGVILYCGNEFVTDEIFADFAARMQCAGLVDKIDESKIDAASAISGCGPAFVYMFIEALADGGVQCGLTRQQALAYAAQTLAGSARQVLESGVNPEELKDRVCSPGGTTIAGVHALEENKFRFASAEAVIAAYEKTLALK